MPPFLIIQNESGEQRQMELLQNILIVWGVIAAIGAAVGIVSKLIKDGEFIFSKTPTAKLQIQVQKNTEYIRNDNERFTKLESQIALLENRLSAIESKTTAENERINESLSMLGTSLAAMLNHMIDGNGVDQMKEERSKLTAYFFNRPKGVK